jgi:hypothetical protein
MVTKKCSKCKGDKILDEYHKTKSSKDGYHHYCKVCNNRYKAILYATNPKYKEKSKLNAIKIRYGLTPEELNLKFLNQNKACAICEKPLILHQKETHIDHNHETGKTRDILCRNCNFILGLSGESVDYLKTMISYIEKHNL